jgi:hypothetical protein
VVSELEDFYSKSLQNAAENGPCACGKRESAEPQIPVSEFKMREDHESESIRVCQNFECGICHLVHKMEQVHYVSPEVIRYQIELARKAKKSNEPRRIQVAHP